MRFSNGSFFVNWLLRVLAACALSLGLLQAASAQQAGGEEIVFAVNEGVTYRGSGPSVEDRYKPVAADLSRILKKPVKVVGVSGYKELKAGLAERKYGIAYVHPAHHAIRAMVKSDYKLAAITKGFNEYRASFFVKKDAPLKALEDMKDKTLMAPDEDSITSVLTRATLRDLGMSKSVKVTYVRYQDAVPFAVEHGMSNIGVTASKSILKEWEEKGGRIVGHSKPIPIKQLLVSSKLSPDDLEKITEYFVTLDTNKANEAKLEALKVKGFMPFDEKILKDTWSWLGVE